MAQQSIIAEVEHSLPANVQELHPLPATDRAPVIEPKPAALPPVTLRGRIKRLLTVSAAVALLAGAGWYGWDYWRVGRFLVSTDDAYVKADNTTVAPKVSGYISEVLVGDNEPVKAGQVLARIDALAADEDAIVAELDAVQGSPVDLGGYYQPDEALATAAMRPSTRLNAVIDAI